MPRTEARIKTDILRNKDWQPLPALSKLTYYTILAQPTLNLCGVIAFTPKPWATDMTLTERQARVALDKLEADRFVVIDDKTDELWVRSFVKNDGVISKPFVAIAMSKDFCTIRSERIQDGVIASIDDIVGERFGGLSGGRFMERLPELYEKAYNEQFPGKFAQPFVERITK